MKKIFTYICLLTTLVFSCSSCTSNYDDYEYSSDSNDNYSTISITKDEAIQENWDSIKEYVSGTETIEACCDSGCYSLEVDISSGEVSQIYFPNTDDRKNLKSEKYYGIGKDFSDFKGPETEYFRFKMEKRFKEFK